MKCPGCGEEVKEGLWFCPHCEASLRETGGLPVRKPGGAAPELEQAVPEETPEFDEKLARASEAIHRSIIKSWIVRIAIAVFLITLLIILLLVLSRTSKGDVLSGLLLIPAILGSTVRLSETSPRNEGVLPDISHINILKHLTDTDSSYSGKGEGSKNVGVGY